MKTAKGCLEWPYTSPPPSYMQGKVWLKIRGGKKGEQQQGASQISNGQRPVAPWGTAVPSQVCIPF